VIETNFEGERARRTVTTFSSLPPKFPDSLLFYLIVI